MFGFTLAAFGVIDIVLFSVFLVALIIGAACDRRGIEPVKWCVLVVGSLVLGIWNWSDWSVFGPAVVPAVMSATGTVEVASHTRFVLVDAVTSFWFWKPVCLFLAAGLVYSVLEFVLAVRRNKREYSKAWESFLTSSARIDQFKSEPLNTINVKALLQKSQETDASDEIRSAAQRAVSEFVSHQRSCNKDEIVLVKKVENTVTVEPVINKAELASSIGVWTVFWPAYAVSLVVGDLLVEIFRVLADFLTAISSRLVKLSFANVFKF